MRTPDMVSIIIPCFNEESKIEGSVRAIAKHLESMDRPAEIVLVNDGSSDATEGVAQDLARELPFVRVISYPTNRGRGYALRRGFEQARGAILVTTEADLSWGADIVPLLVSALESVDREIVIASPYARGGRLENVPIGRAWISRIGNWILSSTLPQHFTMVSGMTRAYRREVIDSLDLESDGKELHVEILVKALVLGYVIQEIPATLRWEIADRRARGRRGTFRIGRVVMGHATLWALERPMLLFGLLGTLLLFSGIGVGGYVTILRFRGDLSPGRPLMTLVVILVLGGFQVLAFGFIAALLVRLRHEAIRLHRSSRQILRSLKETAWPRDASNEPPYPPRAPEDLPRSSIP